MKIFREHSVSVHLANLSLIFPSFNFIIGQLLRDVSEFLPAEHSHYVHLLVANSVCLLFAAELVVYSSFSVQVFFFPPEKSCTVWLKTAPIREVGMNQYSIFYCTQFNNELQSQGELEIWLFL